MFAQKAGINRISLRRGQRRQSTVSGNGDAPSIPTEWTLASLLIVLFDLPSFGSPVGALG
jgi:hypothetical protein